MYDPLQTFSDPEGDVTIRSSDGVDFCVRKSKLEAVSPAFSELFSKSTKDKRTLAVDIESSILDYIVRFAHFKLDARHQPVCLDELVAIFDAAEAYGIEPIFENLLERLLDEEFLKDEPLRVYAIACRFEWEKVARVAARATLRHLWEDLPDCDELEKMTGAHLRRLEQYHQQCGRAAAGLSKTGNLTWIEGKWSWFERKCHGRKVKEVAYEIGDEKMVWFVSSWWTQYMASTGKALLQQPCHESIREGCKNILFCSCCETSEELGLFADMFCLALDNAISKVSRYFVVRFRQA